MIDDFIKLFKATRSQELDQLMEALSNCHRKWGVVIGKDKSAFKGRTYATLPAILDFICQYREFGLNLTQQDMVYIDKPAILTELHHWPSKQYTSSLTLLTPNVNHESLDQAFGGSSTYKRRYAAMGICGLFCADDPSDNDGYATSDKINDKELVVLQGKLNGDALKTKKILDFYKISHLADLPYSKYSSLLESLEPKK